MVVPNIFGMINVGFLFLTYSKVDQFTCTEQLTPDISDIHR